MKRVAVRTTFFLLLLAGIFVFPRPAQAACVNNFFQSSCSAGKFLGHQTLTYSSDCNASQNPFCSTDAQCTHPIYASGVTATVCCDSESEANSVDSKRSPLCGSAPEQGATNSTCWVCGTDLRCNGLDFGSGQTDGNITDPSVRIAIPPDECTGASCTTWRVAPPPSSFMFNGQPYEMSKYGTDGLVVCNANNAACSPSDTGCFNYLDNNITTGPSGEMQCQTIVLGRDIPALEDPDISLRERSWSPSNEPKTLLTNIGGDNDRGRGPQFSSLTAEGFSLSSHISGVFQVNYPDGTPITRDERSNWGVTLMELNTNNDILAPKIGYDIGGGFNYTVLYADANELTLKATLEDSAAYGYTLHFVDLDVNPEIVTKYTDNEPNRANSLVAMPCGYTIGKPKNSTSFKVAVADTGTFMDPRVQKDWWNEPVTFSCTGGGLGYVKPQATTICAVRGKPQETGVAKTAGAVDFAKGCTDESGNVSCVLARIALTMQGSVFPIKNIIKIPDLARYVSIMTGAYSALTPSSIKRAEKKIMPLTFSATGTVSTETDEPKNTCFAAKRGVITTLFTGLNDFLLRALELNAPWNPFGGVSSFDFVQKYPDQYLSAGDNRGCPPASGGIEQKTRLQGSADKHEYDIPEPIAGVLLAAARIPTMFNFLNSGNTCNKNEDPNCQTGAGHTINVILDTNVPYGDTTIPETINVNKSGQRTGFAGTFLPEAARKTYAPAISKQQELDHPDIGNPVPLAMDVPFAGLGGAIEGIQDALCTTVPAVLQSSLLQWACDKIITGGAPIILGGQDVVASNFALDGGAGSSSSPAPTLGRSGALVPRRPDADTSVNPYIQNIITQAAASVGVPRCALEAVGIIESAYAWGAGDNNPPSCVPNRCSAAGPFQITTGKDGSGSPGCEQCTYNGKLPAWIAQNGCPNAWGSRASTPCDIPAAARAAAQIFKAKGGLTGPTVRGQEQKIINAGNNYFGSSSKNIGLGNMSYGDFVLARCSRFPL